MTNMDYVDECLKLCLNKEIDEPYSYEQAINKALYQRKHISIFAFFQNVLKVLL